MKKRLSLTILTGLAIVSLASQATATSPDTGKQVANQQTTASPNAPQQPDNNLLNGFNTAVKSTQDLVSDIQSGAASLIADATTAVSDKLEELIGGPLSNIFSFFGGNNGNTDGILNAAKNQSNSKFTSGINETLAAMNKGISAIDAASSIVSGQGNKTDTSTLLGKASAALLVANTGASNNPTSSSAADVAGLKALTGTETAQSVIGNNGLAQLAANNAKVAILAQKNDALAQTERDTSIENLQDLKKGIANSTNATQVQTEVQIQNLQVQAAALGVDSEKLALEVAADRKASAEKNALVAQKGRNVAFLANLTAPQYIPLTTK